MLELWSDYLKEPILFNEATEITFLIALELGMRGVGLVWGLLVMLPVLMMFYKVLLLVA